MLITLIWPLHTVRMYWSIITLYLINVQLLEVNETIQLGVMTHSCNACTREIKAGGLQQIRSQSERHSKYHVHTRPAQTSLRDGQCCKKPITTGSASIHVGCSGELTSAEFKQLNSQTAHFQNIHHKGKHGQGRWELPGFVLSNF